MLARAFVLSMLVAAALGAFTIEELQQASADLQKGELDDQGFDIFRQQAQQHPKDWRAHAMLGQAHGQLGQHAEALESLRTAYKLEPSAAHVAVALAGELTRRGEPDRKDLVEAAELYGTALKTSPEESMWPPETMADAYAQLGHTLAAIHPVGKAAAAAAQGAETPNENVEDDACKAWKSAIGLAPKHKRAASLHLLIAERLSQGDKASQRPRAIQAAAAAVRLIPKTAAAYDALGGAFFVGVTSADAIGSKHRKRAVQALESAIELRRTTTAEASDAKSVDSKAADVKAAALTHSRLSRLLISDPALRKFKEGESALNAAPATDEDSGDGATASSEAAEAGGETGGLAKPSKPGPSLPMLEEDGAKIMGEAVRHLRAAAKLDPATYAEQAKNVAGWEEAVRQYKQADVQSMREREQMVAGLHREFKNKREQEEEDEAIKVEARGGGDGGVSDTRIEYDYEKKAKKAKKKPAASNSKDEV